MWTKLYDGPLPLFDHKPTTQTLSYEPLTPNLKPQIPAEEPGSPKTLQTPNVSLRQLPWMEDGALGIGPLHCILEQRLNAQYAYIYNGILWLLCFTCTPGFCSVCVYIYIYIHICVCIYIYIHIFFCILGRCGIGDEAAEQVPVYETPGSGRTRPQ